MFTAGLRYKGLLDLNLIWSSNTNSRWSCQTLRSKGALVRVPGPTMFIRSLEPHPSDPECEALGKSQESGPIL